MAAEMRALADDLGAPLVIVLEGGYDLDALARSVAATMAAVADGLMPEEAPASPIWSAPDRTLRGGGRHSRSARSKEGAASCDMAPLPPLARLPQRLALPPGSP